MTKTFTSVFSDRFANPGPILMMVTGINADGSFVWNFEFRSLGFVWDLVFGAWNFCGPLAPGRALTLNLEPVRLV
jgi:hypothetical protein